MPPHNNIGREIAKIFLLFVLFYALILFVWLHIKTDYNLLVMESVLKLFNGYFGFITTDLQIDDTLYISTLSNSEMLEKLSVEMHLKINISAISANIPMSLAATLALIVAKGSTKRDYLYILHVFGLLFMLHFTTVYVQSLNVLSKGFISNEVLAFYLQAHTLLTYDFNYLAKFLANYVYRFEPFLMMLYVWLRLHYRKREP
jgi:hypothetical protein